MKIGINGYEAVVPRFGYNQKTGLPQRVGSGEYCYQLLLTLSKIDKKNDYTIYLPTFPPNDFPKESKKWHYKIIKKKSIWTLFDLSLYFLRNRVEVDIFFSPTHYLPIFIPFPCVISILDLSYLKYPGLFKKKDLYQLKIWTKFSIAKSKRVLTISNSSRDDIIKEYRIDTDKVIVTYPGVKKISSFNLPAGGQILNMEKIKEKYGIKGDYILFVGTLQPRKNVVRLIEAFSRIVRGTPHSLNLIIVGKKGWQYEEILEAPKKFGVKDYIKFLDFVPEEDLPIFYQNALCFVLPSLYEGFGLPVLEAMANGCPVVTSKVSSLPEAGGEAALYVNPEDVDDIVSKIKLLINPSADGKKLRLELIKKGYQQVKKFSWEKTARETLKVLEELAKEK